MEAGDKCTLIGSNFDFLPDEILVNFSASDTAFNNDKDFPVPNFRFWELVNRSSSEMIFECVEAHTTAIGPQRPWGITTPINAPRSVVMMISDIPVTEP